MSIPVAGVQDTGLLSSQLASQNIQEMGTPGSFQTTLNEMLSPDSKGQVNEEQLFAALIKERLTSMKGPEAAQEFETRYQSQQQELQRPDGYINLEDSARAALESMSDDSTLTLKEAETIHGQAFQAAQFDENKSALYDSLGDTMAVTMVELAIQSAESAISSFDAGTATADRLSFDMEDMPVQSPDQSGVGSAAAGSYSDGLIWKPASDTNGDVVIILESKLNDKIDSVTLRDSNGNTLEETSVAMVDDRGRSILFFNQPGTEYPDNVTVQVAMKDGDEIQYLVANPSNRLGY